MTRIVRENYPVSSLPADLREGLSENETVMVVLVPASGKDASSPSLEELLTMPCPPWLTSAQIEAQLDELREDRDH